tara:strand:- start:3602 stop:3964 length:363 start_codon:yes stop_codon:yes gene_type:complete
MKKVLVIDDEKIIRRSLKRILSQSGYEVHEAEDGKAGLLQWQSLQPDMVMVDWIMPGMNGKQLLSEAGSLKDGTKIVVMSAYQKETEKIFWQDHGVMAFIAKPFPNIVDLQKVLKGILDE